MVKIDKNKLLKYNRSQYNKFGAFIGIEKNCYKYKKNIKKKVHIFNKKITLRNYNFVNDKNIFGYLSYRMKAHELGSMERHSCRIWNSDIMLFFYYLLIVCLYMICF